MMQQPAHKQPQTAFTLVEVIVATLIFMLVASGLFATISALSRPSGTSTREMTAALVAKGLLENLRMNIDAATWDSGAFTLGEHTLPDITINGVDYEPTYVVSADPDGSEGRTLSLTVEWEE